MHFREDGRGCPIRLWNKHVKIEEKAIEQLEQIALMPFVGPYVAAMPDCQWIDTNYILVLNLPIKRELVA